MRITGRRGAWRIVDLPEDVDEDGPFTKSDPYSHKADAEADMNGMLRFLANQHRKGYVVNGQKITEAQILLVRRACKHMQIPFRATLGNHEEAKRLAAFTEQHGIEEGSKKWLDWLKSKA